MHSIPLRNYISNTIETLLDEPFLELSHLFLSQPLLQSCALLLQKLQLPIFIGIFFQCLVSFSFLVVEVVPCPIQCEPCLFRGTGLVPISDSSLALMLRSCARLFSKFLRVSCRSASSCTMLIVFSSSSRACICARFIASTRSVSARLILCR
jgi:hypothetical protein